MTDHHDQPNDKQETFRLTHNLAEAVLRRHGNPTDDEIVALSFAIAADMLTTEQFVGRHRRGTKVPIGLDVREMIIGRDGWLPGRVPPSVVAIDVNLLDPDVLNPASDMLAPVRWFGIYHLVRAILSALQGELDPQSWGDCWETIASLLALLKPAYKKLTPVQIAVMGVAHDLEGEEAPWPLWLDQVNVQLARWRHPRIDLDTLRGEVADLREAGFEVHDGAKLRIPTSVLVASVKRLEAVTNALRGK